MQKRDPEGRDSKTPFSVLRQGRSPPWRTSNGARPSQEAKLKIILQYGVPKKKKDVTEKIMLKTNNFRDYDNNIGDNVDNVEDDDVENDYVDFLDYDMVESDETLIN
ncbi:hypothetical protein CEXT_537371 [Caerostris extrusa]|uniref:Uncharacterized protein n=1 Tax=Caerostris extrusa TaxID=172846 RepID=A0AAV4TR95_CAEEX|nr:hypothetical protein CEXT_537371 [Caerostris extrusa]